MPDAPLARRHREAGARLVEFAGWRLPLQFSSIAEETRTTRRAAALFDISHMGVLRIFGADAHRAARRLLTRDTLAIPLNCSRYALLCNDAGGILDDLFVMSESRDAVRLIVNAANHAKDVAWIRSHLDTSARVAIDDALGRTFGLALQGPRSQQVLQASGFRGRLPTAFGAFFHGSIAGADLLVSRTGYTGEDGFEIFGSAGDAVPVWDALIQAGADYGMIPAGLAARDVLRQEMGYPLWGQDIDDHTTPLEAGLRWAVDWSGDFIGRAALEHSQPGRRRVGLRVEDRGVARPAAPILLSGRPIGAVTSGTYSHNLQAAVGQGYVEASVQARTGTEIEVEVRGRRLRARIAELPFLPARTRLSWTRIQCTERENENPR